MSRSWVRLTPQVTGVFEVPRVVLEAPATLHSPHPAHHHHLPHVVDQPYHQHFPWRIDNASMACLTFSGPQSDGVLEELALFVFLHSQLHNPFVSTSPFATKSCSVVFIRPQLSHFRFSWPGGRGSALESRMLAQRRGDGKWEPTKRSIKWSRPRNLGNNIRRLSL